MSVLPRLVSYDKILRGKIFNVAVPHISKRPLDFVIKSPRHEKLYEVITKLDGFEGERDPKTGKKYSPTLKVVTEFKLRPAIIIQNDEFNQREQYLYTVVLPVSKIQDSDRTDPVMQRVMKENDLKEMHFIGRLPGIDSYITIDNPKVIHKNLLFESPVDISVPEEMMIEIMKKYAQCFEIKRIKECDDCSKNCEKCEYKLAVNK